MAAQSALGGGALSPDESTGALAFSRSNPWLQVAQNGRALQFVNEVRLIMTCLCSCSAFTAAHSFLIRLSGNCAWWCCL